MSKKKSKQAKQQPVTVPVNQPVEKKPFIRGRTLRAYVGFAIIAIDVAIFLVDHLVRARAYELLEITGHVLFIGVGFLLIDPKLFTQFFNAVGSRFSKK